MFSWVRTPTELRYEDWSKKVEDTKRELHHLRDEVKETLKYLHEDEDKDESLFSSDDVSTSRKYGDMVYENMVFDPWTSILSKNKSERNGKHGNCLVEDSTFPLMQTKRLSGRVNIWSLKLYVVIAYWLCFPLPIMPCIYGK